MRNFHDDQHANNRLSRCYVIVTLENGDKRLSRIESATKDSIRTSCGLEFPIKSDKIDYMLTKFGYVNTRHQCAYVTRSSKRAWKVGITPDNLRIDPMYAGLLTHRDNLNSGTILDFLYKGEYPNFDKCLREISGGKCASKAFSRKFCLGLSDKTKEIVLYYQNLPIGHYSKDDKALVIGDVNSHLVQSLVEVIGKGVNILI